MSDLLHYGNSDIPSDMVERVARRAHVLRYGEPRASLSGSLATVFSPSGEELSSARVALCEVMRSSEKSKKPKEAFVERIAEVVHDAWLLRNRSRADPEERLPYVELSEETKEKDRVYARAALDVFSNW